MHYLSLVPFRKKFESFFYNRLGTAFNHDDVRSYKLVGPKCCRANTATHFLVNFSYIYFSFFHYYFYWGSREWVVNFLGEWLGSGFTQLGT